MTRLHIYNNSNDKDYDDHDDDDDDDNDKAKDDAETFSIIFSKHGYG